MEKREIRMVVACWDEKGRPAFFGCTVTATSEDVSINRHYHMAIDLAVEAGYCGQCSAYEAVEFEEALARLRGQEYRPLIEGEPIEATDEMVDVWQSEELWIPSGSAAVGLPYNPSSHRKMRRKLKEGD